MRTRLVEIAKVFLRLGATAFGGPAAHIALMHQEFVQRRKWVSEQHFLDMLGATNLIPGPNSTEMAIHLGYVRARTPGLLLAGACFVGPAMVIVTALAWAYMRFGTTPAFVWLLYGVKPVIMAIILRALYSLGKTAVKGLWAGAASLLVFALYFVRVNEILLLLGGGLAVMVIQNRKRLFAGKGPGVAGLLPALGLPALAAVTPFSLPLLFLTFLKIGSVWYGSGYVLLAFLRADFVVRLGWLTDRQLIDAIAVGQVTPGPLLTSATFIGYLLKGIAGALLATVAILIPSFIFVRVTNPIIPRLRQSPWAGGFLDGVNATALGLMGAVSLQLSRTSFIDLPTLVIGAISMYFLLRFKINSTWLILGGALAGLAAHFFN
jgi:chromate transporter